jgi:plasmid stability protein
MSNLSVKDVPEQWAEALRQRAARNHRSLQGELMAIIEAAVRDGAPGGGREAASNTWSSIAAGGSANVAANALGWRAASAGFEGVGLGATRQGWKTVEQIAVELNAKYPQPVMGQPLGADIIREERDAR